MKTIEELEAQLEGGEVMKLPKHVSFSLEHNPHKAIYMTIEEYALTHDGEDAWLGDEQRKKALETNELWIAQWYPYTPIGFVRAWACDLAELLAELAEEP